MMHVLLLLLCTAGFAALALAMRRHQKEVLGRHLAQRSTRLLRSSGWALLLAAISTATQFADGWQQGLVTCCGYASLGAGIVFFALLIRERIAHQAAHRKASRQPETRPDQRRLTSHAAAVRATSASAASRASGAASEPVK